jgi:SpoVK/Ycf46/Vps4 family AAA+-type ATPase
MSKIVSLLDNLSTKEKNKPAVMYAKSGLGMKKLKGHIFEKFHRSLRNNNLEQRIHSVEPYYYPRERMNMIRPRFFPIKHMTINESIETIGDLINLCKNYPDIEGVRYNIDMKVIHAIRTDLEKLEAMIGMKSLKSNILDQILYYLQGFHKNSQGDYLHVVLYGPPGTGKTEIAKIIGTIFCKIGVLPKRTFKKVTRTDFVAGYLGQTALKTRDLFKENEGGVLFIDEAYALGNSEKRDSFSKEAIDTLNELLSDYRDRVMVIIAGYKKELLECFFAYNSGLESRFSWRYTLDPYEADEMCAIFKKIVKDNKWFIEENAINTAWVEERKDDFKNNGRDMENLFSKVKIVHSRHMFGKVFAKMNDKFLLERKDMDKGFELFKKCLEDNDADKNDKKNYMMYT